MCEILNDVLIEKLQKYDHMVEQLSDSKTDEVVKSLISHIKELEIKNFNLQMDFAEAEGKIYSLRTELDYVRSYGV